MWSLKRASLGTLASRSVTACTPIAPNLCRDRCRLPRENLHPGGHPPAYLALGIYGTHRMHRKQDAVYGKVASDVANVPLMCIKPPPSYLRGYLRPHFGVAIVDGFTLLSCLVDPARAHHRPHRVCDRKQDVVSPGIDSRHRKK